MTTIITKYLRPSGLKGARAKATLFENNRLETFTGKPTSLTVSWDHSLNFEQNHIAVAKQLKEKFNITNRLAGVSFNEGKGRRYLFYPLDAVLEI